MRKFSNRTQERPWTQGAGVEPDELGRPVFSFYAPTGLLQRAEDEIFFQRDEVLHGNRQPEPILNQ